jgi:hypothetical protein
MRTKFRIVISFLMLLFRIFLSKGQAVSPTPRIEYEKSLEPRQIGANVLPPRYVIPKNMFPTPMAQGYQQSCVGFAIGYAYCSYYYSVKNHWLPNSDDKIFSPAYLYRLARSCENCKTCGVSNLKIAFDKWANTGNVTINSYPKYLPKDCESVDQNTQSNANDLAKNYKMKDQYQSLDIRNGDLSRIRTHIFSDHPVVILALINEKFKNLGPRDSLFVYKSKKPGVEWHALTVIGYDDNKKPNGAFLIMNSYGPDWGDKGFLWIDTETLAKYKMLQEAWVINMDANPNIPPLSANSKALILSGGIGSSQYTENKFYIKKGQANKVIEDYRLYQRKDTVDIVPYSKSITKKDITIYGRSEYIKPGRYYYTYGLNIDPKIKSHVKAVEYYYNDPSFLNKEVYSYTSPHFNTSYEGWGCVDSMRARIYFDDRSHYEIPFNGCDAIDNSKEIGLNDIKTLNINPVVAVVEGTDKKKKLQYIIKLEGVEPVKDKIRAVVYYWDDKNLQNKYSEVTNKDNNFQVYYYGWDCLGSVDIIIYFVDNSTKKVNLKMCDQLGWKK